MNNENTPQSPQYGQPVPAPQPAHGPQFGMKKRKKWPWITGGVLFLIVAAAACGGDEDTTPTPTATVTVTAEPEPVPEPEELAEAVEEPAQEAEQAAEDEPAQMTAEDEAEIGMMAAKMALDTAGDPLVAAMSDEDLEYAIQSVCNRYDAAPASENVALALLLEALTAVNPLGVPEGSVEQQAAAHAHIAGAAAGGYCSEHHEDSQAEAAELARMGS